MPKIFKVLGMVFKLFFRVLATGVLVLNLVFMLAVIDFGYDLDQKVSTMASAFVMANKIVTDRTITPNFPELIKSNVLIYNVTQGCAGSGTIIQVNGVNVILSCAHLDDPTDTFFVKKGREFRPIRLVKVNHKVDLSVFEYVTNYDDLQAVKIAPKNPTPGDKVWAIGNPSMIENAVTGGTLVKQVGTNYLIDNKIYHGSSGGGLFNTRGEIIGVNVAMIIQGQCVIGQPFFELGLSVDLPTIKAFLAGTIPSEI